MNIFYWSPFFDKIATIKAVIRSAESLIKYRENNSSNNVALIDSIGEWDSYKDQIDDKVKIIKLNKINYTNNILKGGFIKSRISYLFIFFFNFFKLVKLINKNKPDFLIVHLMTSLPIFLSLFFNKKTKIILRISGLPKLNFLRFYFWKFFSKNIYKVTCPTKSTYQYISQKNIFSKEKIFILNDPVVNIKDFITKKKDKIEQKLFLNKKVLVSIGRLTRQKNFSFLISSFKKIIKKYPEYILIILGEGEQRKSLENLILDLKLNDKVHILGYQNNIYKYLNIADCFILSSLWEDPGFVLIEAALSNVNIISSDCPNGPKEILPKNGILFVNNDEKDFIDKFEKFKNMKSDELYRNKLNTKKNIKKFTLFQHFKNLNNILN
jgi:glycosyltransferase involved in cell wall biosynthesis